MNSSWNHINIFVTVKSPNWWNLNSTCRKSNLEFLPAEFQILRDWTFYQPSRNSNLVEFQIISMNVLKIYFSDSMFK